MGSSLRDGCVLVTGATGLLGSHLAERLTALGDQVRALVRPESRTDFLDALGVEIVRGDLTDPAACAAAMAGVDRVFHCAAKVGDWGKWHEFQTGCLDATADAGAGRRAGGRRPLSSYQLDQRLWASSRSSNPD